jgi:hypothetical protein
MKTLIKALISIPPNQKAEELIKKFKKYSCTTISRQSYEKYVADCCRTRDNAKQSAQTCIDEKLELARVFGLKEYIEYYEKVKIEIESYD